MYAVCFLSGVVCFISLHTDSFHCCRIIEILDFVWIFIMSFIYGLKYIWQHSLCALLYWKGSVLISYKKLYPVSLPPHWDRHERHDICSGLVIHILCFPSIYVKEHVKTVLPTVSKTSFLCRSIFFSFCPLRIFCLSFLVSPWTLFWNLFPFLNTIQWSERNFNDLKEKNCIMKFVRMVEKVWMSLFVENYRYEAKTALNSNEKHVYRTKSNKVKT